MQEASNWSSGLTNILESTIYMKNELNLTKFARASIHFSPVHLHIYICEKQTLPAIPLISKVSWTSYSLLFATTCVIHYSSLFTLLALFANRGYLLFRFSRQPLLNSVIIVFWIFFLVAQCKASHNKTGKNLTFLANMFASTISHSVSMMMRQRFCSQMIKLISRVKMLKTSWLFLPRKNHWKSTPPLTDKNKQNQ